MTRVIRILVLIGAAASLLFLLTSSIRLLVADVLSRQPSVHARETAIQLFPGNVTYILSLADFHRQQDLDIRDDLLRATRADPADARLFVDMGLEYERAGDDHAALIYLTEATRLSHEFLPPWSLANYYFRHNNPERFLFWIRRAFEVGTVNMSPAYQLLFQSGLGEAAMQSALPQTERIMVPWLTWLVLEGHLEAARPVAAMVLDRFPGAGLAMLKQYCGELAEADTAGRLQAADLWNKMCARGLLHEDPVYPAREPNVVDSEFRDKTDVLGFGWRQTSSAVPMLHVTRGLSFDFDGNQPEQIDLIIQLLSLRPGVHYVLQAEYDSSGFPSESGVSWRIEDAQTRARLTQEPRFFTDEARSLSIPFTTPATCRFANLVLNYTRQPGTVRITGSLGLKKVALQS